MTDHFIRAIPELWEEVLSEHKTARKAYLHYWNSADGAIPEAICARCETAECDLLSVSAPDIEGIIEKLMVVFRPEMHAGTEDASQKCMIIGDLRRLTLDLSLTDS